MKKYLILTFLLVFGYRLNSQQVEFIEYKLDNGLHVILHQDNNAPVATVSVLYHVGAKDEDPERTGFAHFFEHLLFEGTKNIEKGKWFNIVTSHGGSNNAYTTQDFTYYYENFPSNSLELGLWMESERMLHPVIDQVGVDTQNEVVKEERRLRYDNSPYGRWYEVVKSHLFIDHPYRNSTIGKMEHLDAATLDEFIAFNKKYYIPNNAVLTVAGDIDIVQTKKWIEDYFGPIPKGEAIVRHFPVEQPITETIFAETYDPNIQVPAIFTAYRIPGIKSREAKIMNMISTYLSDGNSSKLYKRLVEDQKMALQVAAFNDGGEDYGTYVILALPQGGHQLDDLLVEIDDEIRKLQTDLISERDYQKLLNIYEDNFVNSNSSIAGIANSLAESYKILGDTNLVNTQIDEYHSITREEIRAAAQKFLNPNQRLILDYLPQSDEDNQELEASE
ncbi:MAG: pitrilysin family protein [Flavobacteriaceae bacterium]|nr:pitrilysin family protein [Flavobacteriaceae bacterium]MCY4266608.1 pitrilysin family protein [Flavobacteriaceae bacterium]MCY4297965.1 pitrilysin family protein [Flavobacteriaceae bacterium]